jgi:hypothetical protein
MFPHAHHLHLTLIVLRYILRFASLLRTSPHSFIPVPAWPLRILLNNTILDRCSDEQRGFLAPSMVWMITCE